MDRYRIRPFQARIDMKWPQRSPWSDAYRQPTEREVSWSYCRPLAIVLLVIIIAVVAAIQLG